MLQGIDHIEIIVRDLDAYAEYLQKLGFELIMNTSHHGDSAELKMPGSDTIFELHQVGGEEVPGINHIALRVDDINQTHAELQDKGIAIEEPPGDVVSTGRTNINLRDPDGWRLQLVDANRRKPRYSADGH
ncbi:MAG: VOC family protein [Rhodospirillaceae bacterium]|nr:VOC family protein [Rhodospirillaceae bacterium]MBT7614020.1 VOC family protein [Rhodospirillaceae bacterium]